MSENRFSGKQVFGIVLSIMMVLVLGLAVGGVVGYQLGRTSAPQPVANAPVVSQVPESGAPAAPQQVPDSDAQPFEQMPQVFNASGPYLGVEFQTLTPEIAASENITGTTGALIRAVAQDGPAAQAGLKAGDIITAVDGQAVDEENDLRSRIQALKAGDTIELTIVTGTAQGPIEPRTLTVTLGERSAMQAFGFQLPDGSQLPEGFQLPDGLDPFNGNGDSQAAPSAPAANAPYLGVEFETLTPEVAASENITGTTGAIIRTVIADSPADRAGLKRGDVVVAVDGQSIDDTLSLRQAVAQYQAGDEITLTIVTGTATGPTDKREVKVTLGTRPADRQWQLPGNLGVPGSRSG